LSRSRVAAERCLAAFGFVLALGGVAFVALLALGGSVGLLDGVSVVHLFAACCGLTVLAAFHAAIALAVGAASGRHGLAVAIAATVAVAGYLVAGLLATSASLRWLQVISPWEWLLAHNVLVEGARLRPLLIEIVISAALVTAGAQRFNRRDLR
jgi:ABC-2 type transport system permease protein